MTETNLIVCPLCRGEQRIVNMDYTASRGRGMAIKYSVPCTRCDGVGTLDLLAPIKKPKSIWQKSVKRGQS